MRVIQIKDLIYVVFEDLAKATGPKVHHVGCHYYQRWLANRTTTTTWYGPYDYEEAWKICRNIALRTPFEPSEHGCVKRYRSIDAWRLAG